MRCSALFYFLMLFGLISCSDPRDLPTVQSVDISKYAGTWYEIARLPNRFEKGLDCVTATYTVLEDGDIEVLNKGRRESGKIKSIKGKAWRPDAAYPGQLKVRFFWPFAGDYYIVELDEHYGYALVGDPSRKYLWILSRSSVLEPGKYDQLVKTAQRNGFMVENLMKVNQSCK